MAGKAQREAEWRARVVDDFRRDFGQIRTAPMNDRWWADSRC